MRKVTVVLFISDRLSVQPSFLPSFLNLHGTHSARWLNFHEISYLGFYRNVWTYYDLH